jgi:hypothetical protein
MHMDHHLCGEPTPECPSGSQSTPPAANASDMGELPGPICPKCGAPLSENSTPSNRVFFACESYRYEGEENLRDQTDLCATREELKDRERELAEARERMASGEQTLEGWASAWQKDREKVKAQAEEIERLRGALQSTFESLTHMKSCRECAEDDWVVCNGGRAAQVALEQAEEALAAQNPAGAEQSQADGEGVGR